MSTITQNKNCFICNTECGLITKVFNQYTVKHNYCIKCNMYFWFGCDNYNRKVPDIYTFDLEYFKLDENIWLFTNYNITENKFLINYEGYHRYLTIKNITIDNVIKEIARVIKLANIS